MSRLPSLYWGIFIAEYSSSKTMGVLHSISELLRPLSPRREPTQKSYFLRPKTIFVQQTWVIFYSRAYHTNQRSAFSSFLSQFPGKHITASMTVLLLQLSEWVATIYILTQINSICQLFLYFCLAYIPTPNRVQLRCGTYAN